jgi:hypothetical protein
LNVCLILLGRSIKPKTERERRGSTVKFEIEEESDFVDEPQLRSDDESDQSNPFPPFLDINPKYIDFTDLLPQYPKTHKDGYATVIELDPDTAKKLAGNKAFGSKMLQTLQYSRSNKGSGCGWRWKKNIQFFSNPSNPTLKPIPSVDIDDSDDGSEDTIPMLYSVRACAGVKACEYFKVTSHTEVDPDQLPWAPELAKQQRTATHAGRLSTLALFESYKDMTCKRVVHGGPNLKLCGGKTVIGSLSPTDGSYFERLFIGCDNYQPNDVGKHTFHKLDKYDPLEVLKTWGRDRSHVHKDILNSLDSLGIN